MASTFMAMVYATLKEQGVDTSTMTPAECVKKFKELNGKDHLKKEEISTQQKKTKQYIGNINTEIYENIIGRPLTNKNIIIANTNIQHTKNRHDDVYEKYKDNLIDIINNPDYIFEGNTDNRVLSIKKIDKNVEVVLELSFDNTKFSNKIVSMWEISDNNLESLKKNKKTLYKK